MIHKISEMCDKITVIYTKSNQLRTEKYVVPKELRDEAKIQYLIDDIKALSRAIANDTDKYTKQTVSKMIHFGANIKLFAFFRR